MNQATAEKTILDHTDHRPFPLPDLPWVNKQTWDNLLFAHWPIPADALQALIPEPFVLDTFEGQAWIGISPFEMRDFTFRPFFKIPGATDFGEVNVRTYVRYKNKPGIYFFSLDASSLLAVIGARIGVALPYHTAQITTGAHEGYHTFHSKRSNATAELEVVYGPLSPVYESDPGSLEAWLTERYCLFTKIAGVAMEVDIHHLKWPLQKAKAEFRKNTLTADLPFDLPEQVPLLHFSAHLDVLVWPVKKASGV